MIAEREEFVMQLTVKGVMAGKIFVMDLKIKNSQQELAGKILGVSFELFESEVRYRGFCF